MASYELATSDTDAIVDYCNTWPNAVVWSLKKWTDAKADLLKRIRNRKIHYSCGAHDLYNPHCDVSLVDCEQRIYHKSMRTWIKGKDPDKWPLLTAERKYDYCVIGKPKAGKNQGWFINELADNLAEPRSFLWIGGSKEVIDIKISQHSCLTIPYVATDCLPALFAQCKVGAVFTTYEDEGFPQSYLEMAMCGLPVVYHESAPWSDCYGSPNISVRANSKNVVALAETLRREANHTACRSDAVNQFSIEKSIDSILSA